jgi:O-antigen ligase
MVTVGYWMMLLYALFTHSRIMELLAPGFRLPLVLAIGGLLLAVVGGTIVRGFTSPIAIAFILLTLWFIFGVPFGSYPSGSLRFILNAWSKNWALFLMVVSLVSTRRQCSRMVVALAIGSTLAALGALATGTTDVQREAERLALEGSSLNDPNTLGMTLLVGLPMWMTVIADRSRYLTTRLAALLCTLPILVAIPLTGSRGTLVGAFVVGLFLFKDLSMRGKAALIVVVSTILILAGTFLTSTLLDRYSMVTDPDQIGETASTESRVYLFKQGLRLIARNPITGVGVGMFAVAENDLSVEQGLTHGTWHTCHNMFMQVASETGLPALVLYLMVLWSIWKKLGVLERIRLEDHPHAREIVRLAFWLRVAFLAFCSCGLFLSSGLSPMFVLLTSLPVAFDRVVRREIGQLEQEKLAEGGGEIAPLPRLERLPAAVQSLRSEA